MKKCSLKLLFITFITLSAFIKLNASASDNSYVNLKESEKITDDIDFRMIKKVDLSRFDLPSCQDVPVIISRCIPSVCSIKAPFGEVIVTIKSSTNNVCQYSEKTIGIGGLDCNIPTSELEVVERAFQKRFSYLAQQNVEFQMSPIEVQTNEQIFNKNCIFKKDFALTSFVTIGILSDQERNIDPEIKTALKNNLNNNPVTQNIAPNTKSPNSTAVTSLKKINLQNFTSIIYTNDELDFITRLIEGLTNTSDVKSSYGSVISKGPGVYTLDSLIFRTSESWTVWLNGTRYDEKNTGDTVKIVSATKNSVIFKWDVPNIQRVSPNWKDHLVLVSDGKYASEKNDVVLEVVSEKVSITFRLQPRQTFIAETMEITEGK